jgi:undecaprenyl-diphosphatase
VGHLIGFEGEKAKTFDMVIQLGAILAIVLLYRNRLSSLFNIKPIINKENKFNAIHIILGVMPAIIVGFILHDMIKTFLFTPITVLLGLVFGAILMIFAEVKKRNPITHSLDEMTYQQALIIGLFQCLAYILVSHVQDQQFQEDC